MELVTYIYYIIMPLFRERLFTYQILWRGGDELHGMFSSLVPLITLTRAENYDKIGEI
ncbi:MAG: hypothetical protein FWG70_09355 [Oscillospiraceae bacterium]|nr:hypothetical protein [Oscillospiraceae bacterium]